MPPPPLPWTTATRPQLHDSKAGCARGNCLEAISPLMRSHKDRERVSHFLVKRASSFTCVSWQRHVLIFFCIWGEKKMFCTSYWQQTLFDIMDWPDRVNFYPHSTRMAINALHAGSLARWGPGWYHCCLTPPGLGGWAASSCIFLTSCCSSVTCN